MMEATEAYIRLLRQYGRKLDLSSEAVIANPEKHLAAALAYGEFLPQGAGVLDIGSGGGLPAIPLAITRPDLRFTLVEIRQKRAAFLDIAIAQLGLSNVHVYNGDVRKWKGKTQYVTAQAVGTFTDLFNLMKHSALYPLTLIARKGKRWQEEAAKLQNVQRFYVKPLAEDSWLVALQLGEPS